MTHFLWTAVLLSFLLYTYGTFEELRNSKFYTPRSIDLAFVLMSLVACIGVALL